MNSTYSNISIDSNVPKTKPLQTKKKIVKKLVKKDTKRSSESISGNPSNELSTTLDIFDNGEANEQHSVRDGGESQSSEAGSTPKKSHVKKAQANAATTDITSSVQNDVISEMAEPIVGAVIQVQKLKPVENQLYTVYKVPLYKKATGKFIKTAWEKYELKEVIKLLEKTDGCYHTRIHGDNYYKLFGDIDHYKKDFNSFSTILIKFLHERYGIKVSREDISYTENKGKVARQGGGNGSYHYVIPKYFGSCQKIKEIHAKLLEEYRDEFTFKGEKKTEKVIDTSIYGEKWFRCPNQSKEKVIGTEHKIIKGTMKDFVLEYIDEAQISLGDYQHLQDSKPSGSIAKDAREKNSKKSKIKNSQKPVDEIDPYESKEKDSKKLEMVPNEPINGMSPGKKNEIKRIEWAILYKFFDECFKQERFDDRDTWIQIGIAIKNRYGDWGLELFRYFSKKATKPDPEESLQKTYNGFKVGGNDPATIATIYYYAKEDNKETYIKLIKTDSPFAEFSLTSHRMASLISMLRPNDFVWIGKELYCYNGKFWENDDLLMLNYIGSELFDFLKDILVTCFWTTDKKMFDSMKRSLDRLQALPFQIEIMKSTRKFMTNNEIEFDTKDNLLGFKNIVYDLTLAEFRNYRQDDYISITTGYNWIEPTVDEVNRVRELLASIHRIEPERNFYLEILSTSLRGKCLEKFLLANGPGRNGKGAEHDLLLAGLGNYAMIASNALLFEKTKTGSCPERANIHKKRLIIFRELTASGKIENNLMKEITGGGSIAARGHYEQGKDITKILHNTTIVECNKKPNFAQEPTRAEIGRVIDFPFRVIFVETLAEVDEANNMFLGNEKYKDKNWQDQHKRALMKILFIAYKGYMAREYRFDMPKSIADRTTAYLELSSNLLGWITESYEKTTNQLDIVKLAEMYKIFQSSEYYNNLSKADKRKYNYKTFVQEIEENQFIKKYYIERKRINGVDYRSILTNFKIKIEQDRPVHKKFDNNQYIPADENNQNDPLDYCIKR
ncbi:MAG: DNA primase [Hyperionvirus sp.]|uniref:DNA primase n=1 Tax=Hyperionvirus sp. TaxID=2487770 RepID=A0A3G5ACA1_9VIRU|nr:MAG: DNA primase [Hyperionvirus sp.]